MSLVAVLGALRSAASIGASWAVLALGAYISYKILDFADLSVDGTFALGGVVSATLIDQGMNPFLTLIFSLLAGMLGGLCTAFIHTKLKIPGLLSGILTMLALYPINLRIMGGRSNLPLLKADTIITIFMGVTGFSKDIARMIIGFITCALLIALMYLFFGTELGCAVRASGDNPKMAKAMGINTNSMIMLGLTLSNGLVGLSGALVAQGNGFADVGMGTGAMVIGLISIIIGSAAFRFLRPNFALKLVSAVVGAVLYRIIIGIVLQTGLLKTEDTNLLTVSMMIIVIAAPKFIKKRRNITHEDTTPDVATESMPVSDKEVK